MRFPSAKGARSHSFLRRIQEACSPEALWKNLINISLDLLGKSDIEGLYLKDDMAIAMEYPMHEDSLKHASKVFQRIYETCLKGNAENIYLSIIPDKNYFLQDDDSALTMDYDDFFQTMQDANPQMHYIDIAPLLELTDYYQSRYLQTIFVALMQGRRLRIFPANHFGS